MLIRKLNFMLKYFPTKTEFVKNFQDTILLLCIKIHLQKKYTNKKYLKANYRLWCGGVYRSPPRAALNLANALVNTE